MMVMSAPVLRLHVFISYFFHYSLRTFGPLGGYMAPQNPGGFKHAGLLIAGYSAAEGN